MQNIKEELHQPGANNILKIVVASIYNETYRTVHNNVWNAVNHSVWGLLHNSLNYEAEDAKR